MTNYDRIIKRMEKLIKSASDVANAKIYVFRGNEPIDLEKTGLGIVYKDF